MHFHRFATKVTVMFIMAAFLLSAFSPLGICMDATEEERGTQEVVTDENGEKVSEEPATDENGEIIPTLPQYIIVENTTADPDATTEVPTEEPTVVEYETVTDEYGEMVTDENGEAVTEIATEAPITDENGEIITTEAITEEATEPPVPDALSENGLLLTIAARDADYGYRIVIPKNCPNETGYAAGLLQTTIQKMTGVLLPIVSDQTKPQAREICIGNTNRTKKDPVGVSENGFFLHTQDERLFLYALGEQGAIYAVTAFLKEACGCNWFASGQTEIPSVQALSVNAKLSLQRGVCFSYTETYSAFTDADFLQMNSLTGGAYMFVSDDGSPARTYLTDCEETLGTRFVSAEDYFETHPEYFSLYNNERNAAQLCLSSWDVYAVCLQEIENILRAEWVPAQKKQVICLSLPQNDVVCQCSQCTALTQQNGSYAGVLIQFLNRISAGLYASGYSNLQLETFISGTVFTVPTVIRPAGNVIVRVSAQNRCVGHALNHTACEYNRYFLDMLRLWIQIAPTVYVDLPTENTAHTIGIFADMKHLQTDVQTLYYLGVQGLCAADSPFSADCGPAFRALRIYLLTRLFADPYCNLTQERRAFLRSWYGDGYVQFEQILDLLCDNAGNSQGHLFTYSDITDSLSLTAADVQKIDRLWDEAIAVCSDGRQLLHTEQSRLAWRFWQACCSVGAFGEDAETDVTQQLIADLQQAGINRYSVENETLHLSFLSKTLRPQEWNTPALTLMAPWLNAVRKVLMAVCIIGLLVLSVAALLRKRILFLLPLWAFVVVCALLPWHTESIANESVGMGILTSLFPLLYIGMLSSMSLLAKYDRGKTTDLLGLFTKKEDKKQEKEPVAPMISAVRKKENVRISLTGVLAFAVAAVPYFVLVSLPSYTSATGEQLVPVCLLLLSVYAVVSVVILTVLFLRKRK
ncbi:MAG: DUF4838 domain-containing protein [Ruminococcaceae bacterium]|nr:DUF4838 domain-containing protein [Oscillospiraceae bacterium]